MSKLQQAQSQALSAPAQATPDETRTPAGSNYGDVTPSGNDPFRGAEMERDVLPASADFSRPPEAVDPSFEPASAPGALPGTSREERIRLAAHARYERRGGLEGDALQDWLDAEAEIDRLDR